MKVKDLYRKVKTVQGKGQLLAEVVHLQHEVGQEGTRGAEAVDGLPVLGELRPSTTRPPLPAFLVDELGKASILLLVQDEAHKL